MRYWRSGGQGAEAIRFVVRLDVGDEIISCLTELQAAERFGFAQVTGLGAADEVEIGVFDTVAKAYHGNAFRGTFEITNLTANLTMMDGKPYVHAHMTFGDGEGRAYGGHLTRARISATGELLVLGWRDIRPEADVDRRFHEAVGLNLLEFPGK